LSDTSPEGERAPRPPIAISLEDGAKALGIELTPATAKRLLAYLDAMLEINRELNLTSIRDRDDAIVRHLLDSLSVVPLWHAMAGAASPRRVLDLGTGGGFPGAALAAAWPKSRVTMIDSTGKKVRAVAKCLKAADIRNAETYQARGEQLPGLRRETRGAFDLCIARAVGPAARLVREFAPLVASPGRIFLMKGGNTSPDEIAAGAEEAAFRQLAVEETRTVNVPGLEPRLVLVYARS
jgi:16S rRNA (guanine527-N7)-methyltransferase